MSKNAFSMPVDQPTIVDQETRLVQREADFFGQDSRFGFSGVQMTNFIGLDKGNRPVQGSPAADDRFAPAVPFINPRRGR